MEIQIKKRDTTFPGSICKLDVRLVIIGYIYIYILCVIYIYIYIIYVYVYAYVYIKSHLATAFGESINYLIMASFSFVHTRKQK